MNASAPSRGLGPFAALAISLAWLVVLAPLAYPYLKNGPIGGIPIAPFGSRFALSPEQRSVPSDT